MKNLLISLLLLAVSLNYARSQHYNFRNYSVKDGVAQSQVYSLLQDKRGFIWMGTRGGGLTSFDGQHFKTYTEKDGLVNNYVYALKEDRQGLLWIGTNNGLSRYNGREFTTLRPGGLKDPFWVMDFVFGQNDQVWIASNQGLYLFEKGVFTSIYASLSLEPSMVNCVLYDRKGRVWIGTGKGLFQVIPEQGKGFRMLSLGKNSHYMNNAITCLREDSQGNIWIGTYGDGAYVYNGKTFSRPDKKGELYRQTVLDIYFDRSDQVWFATLYNGAMQLDRQSNSFQSLEEKDGLSNNHVRSILQDNTGNYWFGTSGGGVCHYFGKQFTTFNTSSGLGGDFIYSIHRDREKRLWVGNSQKGLSCLTDSGFVQFDAGNGFIDTKVKAIGEDLSGRLFFGTDGKGLYIYEDGVFSLIDQMDRKYVRSIIRDLDGDMWVATAGHGIYRVHENNGALEFKNFTTEDGLLYNRITSLCVDKLNRVWYGTETNGLGFIAKGKVHATRIRSEQGLASNAIRSLCIDQRGFLWVGTAGSGLSRIPIYESIQGQAVEIRNFSFAAGLNSANIYLMTIDQNQNLIVGTEAGLDHVMLDANGDFTSIKHYSKGDGFTGVETCQNAVFNDLDGTLWFGTINGLSHFNPASAVKNTHEPILHIQDVKLFYESLRNTSYKSAIGDWNQVEELSFPYNQNHLSFDFLAVNLSNSEGVRYQWKLAGFDQEWSPVTSEHQIVYSNISPGNYLFLVKSRNEDGVWNQKPVAIKIHIDQPYWMNWWFIALEVFVGALLLFLLIFWYTKRIRSQENEEKRKLQLEKNLVELEQKALRLQMNPHFIFNALNSIQALIGTGNEQQARYYLAKFSGLMRQILDNSRNAFISLEEEIKTLENYLMVEQFCNGNRFDYEISVGEGLETDYIKVPPMLIQPFIENAIKHGMRSTNQDEKTERSHIAVHFEEMEQSLCCTVTDNGIGRVRAQELKDQSMEKYHESTALVVTQERLELFNTKGASLEIIDLYDDEKKACGTQVRIQIPLN